jgi:hypothetical protein
VGRGIKWTIPASWSDQTNELTNPEAADLMSIRAPSGYASVTVWARPGPSAGLSSHARAADDATGFASWPETSVSDCEIGGESAAFYQYRDPFGKDVYRLFIVHCPTTKYPPIYLVEITSQGPIDDQVAVDVRALLGSWNWGSNVCSLYS